MRIGIRAFGWSVISNIEAAGFVVLAFAGILSGAMRLYNRTSELPTEDLIAEEIGWPFRPNAKGCIVDRGQDLGGQADVRSRP